MDILCIAQLFMCLLHLAVNHYSIYSLDMVFFFPEPGDHSVLSTALAVHLFTHLFLNPFRHFPSTFIEVFLYSFAPYCPFAFGYYKKPKAIPMHVL